MANFKKYNKVKTKIDAVQWLGKISELPAEIVDNNHFTFDVRDKLLKVFFGNREETFEMNDYIGKENGTYFRVPFKKFGEKYKEQK